MNPSRELDCLVAERCLGYEWYSFIRVACLLSPGQIQSEAWRGSSWEKGLSSIAEKDIEGTTFSYGGGRDANGYGRFRIPEYSKEIEEAMLLVRALRPYKFALSCRTPKGNHAFQIPETEEDLNFPFRVRPGKTIWRCTFGPGTARANHAAVAVCKAALLFVGDTRIPAYVRKQEVRR